MKLDISESIGADFASDDQMRQAMVQISQHVQNRTEHQHWANHLRFLTSYIHSGNDHPESVLPVGNETDDDTTSSTIDDQDEPCSCDKPEFQPFRKRQRDLLLTTPSSTPGCVHYVAVSYCWSSSAKATFDGRPFRLRGADGISRGPNCPASLLDRAIQFAAWKECAFLWIDQECIDQNDPDDQTIGIHSMDLVYQQASYCLAILEISIDSQRHIDALSVLLENGPELEDENVLRDVCEGLQTIMSDPWFERAWCLQESVAGNRQMTLLIRHTKNLDIPSLLESRVDGCFELDLPALHNALAGYQPAQMRQMSEDPSHSVYALYQQLHDDWFENMAADITRDYDPDSRTVCNGAQALCYLQRRENLVVADRIAIMSNLCDYARRLDSVALDKAGFGFSICAIVLSAINGDFSIIAGVDDYLCTGKSGRKSRLLSAMAPKLGRPLTWSPPRSAKLANLSYFEHNAEPLRIDVDPTRFDEGLVMRGSLWVAGCCVDLSDFVADFQQRWPRPILEKHRLYRVWEDIYDAPDPLFAEIGKDFLVSLLCELHKRHLTQIVQLFWNMFRTQPLLPQQAANVDAYQYAQAAFTDVIDIRTQRIKWLSPARSVINYRDDSGHPFLYTSREDIQFLIRTTMDTGKLLLSRPAGTSDHPSSYAAIFDLWEENGSFFVPSQGGYGWYPCCWLVHLKNEASSETFVRAFGGHLTCGMWQHNERDMVQVLLS